MGGGIGRGGGAGERMGGIEGGLYKTLNDLIIVNSSNLYTW